MKLHVSRCKSELEFVAKILDVIEKYDIIAGHNVTGFDSDIAQIQKMCRKVGFGLEDRFSKVLRATETLDTWKIFSNNVLKGALAQKGMEYATNKLNDIALTYIGKGKLDDLTGAAMESMPVETQLEYCSGDCELVVKILQKDDYRILRLEHSISKLIKQDFLVTCRSSPSSWWESLLRSEDYPKPNVEKIGIRGGKVLDPIVGVHKNVVVKDCSSLYPTIASTRNLSSETINPDCCGDVLPDDIMNMINQGLREPRTPYRICTRKIGKFAAIQGNFIELKKQYKEQGLEIEAAGVKLVANSGYGAFGLPDFHFYDPRLAEIITAYGRRIILSLKEECLMKY